MERFHSLLLSVWREACQHIDIAASVGRIAAILAERLPLETVLVRRLDTGRSCIETVAAGVRTGGKAPERTRSDCAPADLERIVQWCRAAKVVRLASATVLRRWPGLLPAEMDGQLLAGPLNSAEGTVGLLILMSRPGRQFRVEHEALTEALLEPLAVAVENDRRLRELTILREAVEADNRSLLSRLGRNDLADVIVGARSGLRAVMDQVDLVAHSDVPVLILGETGSGKEVVARAIHTRSRRAVGPFLRVNCGAIPPELLDSELFGHERGSFTGAVGVHKGWFERADGGTLFLDECGELSPAAQVRLLRILQDGSFQRVGGEQTLHVDVRIVAATHRNLQAMHAQGQFREDLWYRLAVFPIHLPALRDRLEDIPDLAAHFALRAAKRLGLPPLVPTNDDIRLLAAYSWPGNVRELSAVLERAAILGNGKCLEIARALGTAASPGPPAAAVQSVPANQQVALPSLDAAMARHIEQALAQCRGRIEGRDGAAHRLKINPHTLRARMRKLGIEWQRFRLKDPSLGQ